MISFVARTLIGSVALIGYAASDGKVPRLPRVYG
jgi:hypothetical protein